MTKPNGKCIVGCPPSNHLRSRREKELDAKLELASAEPSKTLMPYAKTIADSVLHQIRETVPLAIPTMPYARQWVLEEAIKLLEERV